MHSRAELFPFRLRNMKCAWIVICIPGFSLLKIHKMVFVGEVRPFFVVVHTCVHVAPGDRPFNIFIVLIEQLGLLFDLFCFEQLWILFFCSFLWLLKIFLNFGWFIIYCRDFTLRRFRRWDFTTRRCSISGRLFIIRRAGIVWNFIIRRTWVFDNLFLFGIDGFFGVGYFFYFAIGKFFQFDDWLIRWLGVGPFCYLGLCSFFCSSSSISC